MIVDLLPVKAVRERYHSWKNWPAEMKERTKGLPVVFSNSYQRASKYWFYSGQPTYSQNMYRGRRNNYNFWPVEDSLLGKPVYFLDIYPIYQPDDSLKTPVGMIRYRYDSSFVSFAKIQIKADVPFREGTARIVNGHAVMDPLYRNYILKHPELKPAILIGVFNKKGWIKDCPTQLRLEELTNKSFTTIIDPQLPKGKYYLRFAIGFDGYNPTHNSEKISLTIK